MQWRPVDVRVEQFNLNIMHSIVHGGAPCYLTESFGKVSLVYGVETRQRCQERCLAPCHPLGSKAFKFNNIKLWNNLLLKIKNLNSLSSFK